MATKAVRLLTSGRVDLTPGLTEQKLRRVEETFGFRFAVDHRALLEVALPTGQGFPNWRDPDEQLLTERLRSPLSGVLFDVENNSFWPPSWGDRPRFLRERTRRAEAQLLEWPRLIPIYLHRYMPAGASTGAPVFSVHQTDVIYYGADLLNYLAREFSNNGSRRVPENYTSEMYGPWSRLAVNEDLL